MKILGEGNTSPCFLSEIKAELVPAKHGVKGGVLKTWGAPKNMGQNVGWNVIKKMGWRYGGECWGRTWGINRILYWGKTWGCNLT